MTKAISSDGPCVSILVRDLKQDGATRVTQAQGLTAVGQLTVEWPEDILYPEKGPRIGG